MSLAVARVLEYDLGTPDVAGEAVVLTIDGQVVTAPAGASILRAAALAGITVPERAEYLRVILSELGRVNSHCMFYGAFGADAGATTPFMYAFTLREDALHGLTVGATVALSAQDGRTIDARVTELRPLGEFATWRAARAVGDHDLNAFRLRLDPTGSTHGLEAGTTVFPRSPWTHATPSRSA